MNDNFLNGFVKAAAQSGLKENSIVELVKSAEPSLTDKDLANLRVALQGSGVSPGYDDPSGYMSSRYNQAILAARNHSLSQDPHDEGLRAGIGMGLHRALLGGLGGHYAGHLLRGKATSGVMGGIRKALPKALGLGGALVAGLAAGVPAYEQRKHTVEGLQKLNSPENVSQIAQAIQADKALLAS